MTPSVFVSNHSYYCFILFLSLGVADRESRVPDPPVNVRVVPESYSIYMEWDPPPNAEALRVRGYTVGYSGGGSHIKMALAGEKTTQFSFDALDPDTEYDVLVTAYNDVGDSRPHIEKVRTKPSAEKVGDLLGPFPPINLQVEVLTPTEVELSWEDQELEPNDISDGFREYTIKYARHDNGPGEYELAKSEQTWKQIGGLRPNTEYEFSVRTTTDHGHSAWSIYKLAKTLADAPTSAPYGFKLMSTSGTSVEIAWKPPKEPNGPLTGYELFYTVGRDSPNLSDWAKVDIPGETESFKLKNLKTGILYVKMRALNDQGKGPLSPPVIHSVEGGYTEGHATDSATPKGDFVSVMSPESNLWISPRGKEIERQVGDFLAMSCQPKAGARVSDLLWTFPNGSEVPLAKQQRNRIHTKWAKDLSSLRLVFVELKYTDSGHYFCTGNVNGKPTKKSFSLRVLPSEIDRNNAELFCDFEQKDICGYKQDPYDTLKWQRVAAGLYQEGLSLLLPRDHTSKTRPHSVAGSGHYMYLQALPDGRGVGGLMSPNFNPGFSIQSCFSFWYYVGPSSKGTLNVKSAPLGKIFENYKPLLTLNLSDSKKDWVHVKTSLKPHSEEFRVMIEVEKDYSSPLVLAIDDVQLATIGCPVDGEQGDNIKTEHSTSSNNTFFFSQTLSISQLKNRAAFLPNFLCYATCVLWIFFIVSEKF